MEISSRGKFILLLLVGITVSGFLDYLLSATGASQLGGAVWALGYGTMVIMMWYGWIRPIEFGLVGPDANNENVWEVDRTRVESENHGFAERTDSQNGEHNSEK